MQKVVEENYLANSQGDKHSVKHNKRVSAKELCSEAQQSFSYRQLTTVLWQHGNSSTPRENTLITAAVVDWFLNKQLQFKMRFVTSNLTNGYNFFSLSGVFGLESQRKKQLIKIKYILSKHLHDAVEINVLILY